MNEFSNGTSSIINNIIINTTSEKTRLLILSQDAKLQPQQQRDSQLNLKQRQQQRCEKSLVKLTTNCNTKIYPTNDTHNEEKYLAVKSFITALLTTNAVVEHTKQQDQAATRSLSTSSSKLSSVTVAASTTTILLAVAILGIVSRVLLSPAAFLITLPTFLLESSSQSLSSDSYIIKRGQEGGLEKLKEKEENQVETNKKQTLFGENSSTADKGFGNIGSPPPICNYFHLSSILVLLLSPAVHVQKQLLFVGRRNIHTFQKLSSDNFILTNAASSSSSSPLLTQAKNINTHNNNIRKPSFSNFSNKDHHNKKLARVCDQQNLCCLTNPKLCS